MCPSHLFFSPSHHDPGRHIPSRSQKLGMKHGLLSRRASRPSREFVLGVAGLELLKHLGEGTFLFYTRKCANQELTQAQPNAAPPPMAPQVLLGSGTISDCTAEEREMLTSSAVQDEGLKKLLMSWYYAGEYPSPPCVVELVCREGDLPLTFIFSLGYYTGLYEGKQQAEQQAK